jgi:hypothetical protein
MSILRSGDLVCLNQRERYIPIDLRGSPRSYTGAMSQVPVWRSDAGRYNHVPTGTIATLIEHHVDGPEGLGRCQIMLPNGEIVWCYESHVDVIPIRNDE